MPPKIIRDVVPGADPGPARGLRPGREGGRRPPQRPGRHDHGAARLRAGHAAQADLQLRPARPARAPSWSSCWPTWRRWPRAAARRSSSRSGSSRWRCWPQAPGAVRAAAVPRQDPAQPSGRPILDRFKTDPTQARHPDELRHRQRRAEPAVHELRVPVRPLVEPGRRGPGDQPGAPARARRSRCSSRASSAQDTIEGRIAEVLEAKRQLFNELIAQNGPPPSLGLTRGRNLRPVRHPEPAEEGQPRASRNDPVFGCVTSGVSAISVARLSECPCEVVNS